MNSTVRVGWMSALAVATLVSIGVGGWGSEIRADVGRVAISNSNGVRRRRRRRRPRQGASKLSRVGRGSTWTRAMALSIIHRKHHLAATGQYCARPGGRRIVHMDMEPPKRSHT